MGSHLALQYPERLSASNIYSILKFTFTHTESIIALRDNTTLHFWVPKCLAVCLTRWRKLVPISIFVYDCNRPLAPILRQKMVLSACMMFIDCLMFDVLPN
jgi:hypothetical protein